MSKYKFKVEIKGTVNATDIYNGEDIIKRLQHDIVDNKLIKYNNIIEDIKVGSTVIFGNQD